MSIIDLYNCQNKYDVIVSDPPWKQSKGGSKSVRPLSSGKQLDYKTITLDEITVIQNLCKKICNENHVVFLWTIDKYLHSAEKMMLDLGYKLHARMIWNKVTGIPAAFTIRFGHEYLLWFYYGKLLPISKEMRGKIHSVFVEKVKKHSQKPEISFEIINSFYPTAQRLEMYARNQRQNWDCWGDEI